MIGVDSRTSDKFFLRFAVLRFKNIIKFNKCIFSFDIHYMWPQLFFAHTVIKF